MKMKVLSQHYRDQQITDHFRNISLPDRNKFLTDLENHIINIATLVAVTDTIGGTTKERGRVIYTKAHATYRKLSEIFDKLPRTFDYAGLKVESEYSVTSLTAVFVVGVEIMSLLNLISKELPKGSQKITESVQIAHKQLDGWIMEHAKQAVSRIQAQRAAAAECFG